MTAHFAKMSGNGFSGDEIDSLVVASPPVTTRPYADHISREGLLVPTVGFDLVSITSPTNRSTRTNGEVASTVASRSDLVVGIDVRQDPLVTEGRVGAHGAALPPSAVMCDPNTGIRRLTPVEVERLMGFPDHYTAVPFGRREVAADSHRYRALGNSMAVNVMRWIGERIDMMEGVLRDIAHPSLPLDAMDRI